MSFDKLLNKRVMDLFPKVELHRHLEGSFCLDTLFKTAMANNISEVPKEIKAFKKQAQFPENHKPDFKLFLSKFRNDWYRSYEDIFYITYNSVKLFKQENLFFIELRFSPEHFSLQNDFERMEVAQLIIEAAQQAAYEIGLHIKFLITFNRNKQTQYEMLDLYRSLKKAKLTDIVGWDLAGDEIMNPPEEFVELFDVIHAEGDGITIHAGEVTEPIQIWSAIDLLHATRIGHGTMAIHDEKLQDKLISENIYLEQCPVSNYFTGSCEDTPNHPFAALNKKGVRVTLNSDDPTIQKTTLTDDFIVALKHYDISYHDLVDLNIRSLEGSFVSNKKELIEEYKGKVALFEKDVLKL